MGVIFDMFNRKSIDALKQRFPTGTRILLLSMDDPYSPVPSGTRGTVLMVDDAGQLQMKWDNGSGLAVIPGKDSFRKLTEQELAAEELLDESQKKPKAAIIGANGNIFNLLGIAQKALKSNGQREQADEMAQRVFKSKSYEQALGILMEYVEPVSEDEINAEVEVNEPRL